MKHLITALLLVGVAFAQSGFSGTWKTNLAKINMPQKAESRSYENGIYRCSDCNIKEAKADGKDEKVNGPYFDTFSVKATDNRTIEKVGKKNGKVVAKVTESVSPDGKTLTSKFWNVSENGTEQTGTFMASRVGDAPQGKHLINGDWKPMKFDVSDNVTTVFIRQDGDNISMSSPAGVSFDAKLDGNDYPYQGDPGITSITLRRIDDKTIEATDKLHGKPVFRSTMRLSDDGKSIAVDNEDLRDSGTRNPKVQFIMDRQSSGTEAAKKQQ